MKREPKWISDPHTQYKIFRILGDIEEDVEDFKGRYDDGIAKMKELRNKDEGWTKWELRRKITADKYQTAFITVG